MLQAGVLSARIYLPCAKPASCSTKKDSKQINQLSFMCSRNITRPLTFQPISKGNWTKKLLTSETGFFIKEFYRTETSGRVAMNPRFHSGSLGHEHDSEVQGEYQKGTCGILGRQVHVSPRLYRPYQPTQEWGPSLLGQKEGNRHQDTYGDSHDTTPLRSQR